MTRERRSLEPVDPEAVHAIDEPTFAADWSGHAVDDQYANNGRLGADWTVIGVERGDVARAYPVAVLWYHEVVNDRVDGEPVVITYCQICRSGMIARRTVGGSLTQFRVSGQLWQPPGEYTQASLDQEQITGVAERDGESADVFSSENLVLVDDATGSFWSQLLAQAICGPQTGTRLTPVPATITTWAAWQRTHPDGEVLVPPPHSGTVA